MAYLVASLRALFKEIDDTWPMRDHGLDGWIGDSRHCPGVSDHCADENGRVHAIDIDKDGIDPIRVIDRLAHYGFVVRYMNYNRKQYHKKNGFAEKPLGGSNPHTGHIHVSIEHTDQARSYTDGYGIMVFNLPLMPPLPSFRELPPDDFSHAWHALNIGQEFGNLGTSVAGFADLIGEVRR